MNKIISFVITTHLNPQALKETLQSLANQVDQNFEVIIVSNFFEPKVAEFAKSYSASYLFSGRKGVNRARNLGVQNTKTPYLYFLDDDCYLPDPTFSKRLSLALIDPANETQFIGGYYKSTDSASAPAKAYVTIQNDWLMKGRMDQNGLHAYLVGGNCGGKKELFEKFPFDNSYTYGGSETEMFLRASMLGVNCRLNTDLSVCHNCQVSWWNLGRKAMRQAKGKWKMTERRLSFSPYYHFRTNDNSPYILWYHTVFHFTYLFSQMSALSGIRISLLKFLRKYEVLRRSILEKLIAAIEIIAGEHR